MRAKVGILVNEIDLSPISFRRRNSSSMNFGELTPTIRLEMNLFGQSRCTRSYGIISTTSPVLPCEQFYFFKDFVGFKNIADLLRSFEREPVSMRLLAEYQSVPLHSPLRHEVLANFDDNALNVLYPYHTLHPSYDHVSRRLHLNSVQIGNRPVLVRLTLSVGIFGDDERTAFPRRPTSTASAVKTSPLRPRSQPHSAPRPAYMEPTFSWLMTEHTTRQQFFPSSSSDDRLKNANSNDAGRYRLPRSGSDFY